MSTRFALTRQKIVEEAIAFADAEGLQKVSMRKLGDRLGVEAMSLYNHVKNKEDLIGGMVEGVASEMMWPASDDWQDEMRARAHATYETLRRHPWAAELFLSRINDGPAVLGRANRTIGVLVDAGFGYPLADHVWQALDAFILGFTIQALHFPFEEGTYAEAADQYRHLVPRDVLPHLRHMADLVAERKHDGIQSLDFGLDVMLDGFARMLPDEQKT